MVFGSDGVYGVFWLWPNLHWTSGEWWVWQDYGRIGCRWEACEDYGSPAPVNEMEAIYYGCVNGCYWNVFTGYAWDREGRKYSLFGEKAY